MTSLPNPYQDLSERDTLAYCLGYTVQPVVAEFMSIPEDWLYSTSTPNLTPPAWLLAHLAAFEYRSIQKAFSLETACPEVLDLCVNAEVSELARLKVLHPSKDELIKHWESVRKRTIECLMALQDEQLKDVYPGQCQFCADHAATGEEGKPPAHDPCPADSFRELFVQISNQQNYTLGQLHVIRCLATGTRDVWPKW